ncbi:MAG: hypothetical protein ACD_75C00791G0004, partial [uncultured bacterium]
AAVQAAEAYKKQAGDVPGELLTVTGAAGTD